MRTDEERQLELLTFVGCVAGAYGSQSSWVKAACAVIAAIMVVSAGVRAIREIWER